MDDILGMPGIDRLKICSKVFNQHPVTIESYWNQGVIELLVALNKKNLWGDVTAYQLTRSVTVGYYEIKLHQCVKWKFKLLFTRKTYACFGTLANYRLYMWPMNFPFDRCEWIHITQMTKRLRDGESNPGLPRDRRGYLPLYYHGLN